MMRMLSLGQTLAQVPQPMHMELTENPYFTPKTGLRYHLLGKVHGLTARADFRTFGKKLPAPVQKLIRKVFL